MSKLIKSALLSCAAISLVSAVQAADLVVTNPVIMSPTPAAEWDFYAGFNVGAASGTSTHIGSAIGTMPLSGFMLGGQVGVNRILSNNLVLGGEADLDWTNITGTYTGGPTVTQTINWEGSFTGHLGFNTGNFTPYVLAGIAFASGARTSNIGPTTVAGTHMGFTAGAGASFKVADQLSLFGEVRMNNFGAHIYTGLPTNPNVSLTSAEFRGGLNWHF
jgi:outer membrane immunogenic protein